MALGITIPQLAVAIRLTTCPTEDLVEPELGILTRQHSVAESMIERYANGAPSDVKDEAAVLMVGHLYEMPIGQRSHANAMRQSGAMSLLSFWRTAGSTIVGVPEPADVDDGDDTVPLTPETPSTPVVGPHPGTHYRYIGWSLDTVVTPGEVANGQQYSGDDLTIPDGGPGYVWFVVEAAAGYPDALYYAGNPTNLIGVYTQQAGVVTVNMVDHLVGISASLLGENAEGIVIQLRYNP